MDFKQPGVINLKRDIVMKKSSDVFIIIKKIQMVLLVSSGF